eukprot:4383338-Prymnesium_polylepis.1
MCATARKSWCAAPNFFHVHTPADPTRTPERNGEPVGGVNLDTLRRHFTAIPGNGKGLTLSAGHPGTTESTHDSRHTVTDHSHTHRERVTHSQSHTAQWLD